MISYWEKTLLKSDVIIIGSGLVGMNTACVLKEKNPAMNITILERGILPTGASTRNAGFACFSDISETLEDIKLSDEESTVQNIINRHEGLQKMRKRLGDLPISYEATGGYEPILENHTEISKNQIDYVNKLLMPHFGENVFSFANDKIPYFGFEGVKQLIYNKFEGCIHTGKLIDELWKYANKLGVRIITGAEVAEIDEMAEGVIVYANHHLLNTNIEFTAKKAIICANAFIHDFIPDLNVQPGRGQVIITKPLENININGVFHFDKGYYYFRNIDNRILIGGGRHTDLKQETTTDFESNSFIFEQLISYLDNMIIPKIDYEIDMHWQGIMGFSADKLPIVKKVSDHICIAFSCNGMGVALSSHTAEKAAALIL